MATSKTELRKLFINDLKSGRFKKTTSKLKTGDGQGARYCLLGVALDRYLKEYGPNGIEMSRNSDGSWVFRAPDGYWGHSAHSGNLPKQVVDAYGFWDAAGTWTDKASGRLFTGKDIRNCIQLNDSTPMSFAQMANFIELNPGIWKD